MISYNIIVTFTNFTVYGIHKIDFFIFFISNFLALFPILHYFKSKRIARRIKRECIDIFSIGNSIFQRVLGRDWAGWPETAACRSNPAYL